MDIKSVMWIILGIILILGGIVSSLEQEKSHPAAAPRPVTVEPAPAKSEKDLDTGFFIDPIKGLRRKEANEKYFG